MLIRLSTVRFNGAGSIDCRRCNRKTKFPDGASVVVIDYRLFQVVKSADTLSTLHRCGRTYFWECDTCGGCADEKEVLRRQHRKRGWTKKPCSCGGEFERREEPLAVQPEPDPVDLLYVSPF